MSNKKKFFGLAACTLSLALLFGNTNVEALDHLNIQLKESQEQLKKINERLSSSQDEIKKYENNIKGYQEKKGDINKTLEKLSSKKLTLEDKILKITLEIQQTIDNIYDLEANIVDINAEIKVKDKEIESTKKRIDKNTELLKQRLINSYKLGDVQKIEILLSANDVNDFLSRNKMITTITEYDNKIIENLKTDNDKLNKLVLELNGQKTALEISKKNSEKEKEKLEKQKVEQSKLLEKVKKEESKKYESLNKLNTQIAEYEKNINLRLETKESLAKKRDQLMKEIKELERKILAEEEKEKDEERKRLLAEKKKDLDKVNEEYDSINSGGQLLWPTTARIITSRFGFRYDPITGVPSSHGGLDIAGPYGTPILAAESGVVTEARFDDNGIFGYYVVIKHNDTLSTKYGHMQALHVRAGQRVSRGDLLGDMGSTGYSTGSHLHFEVHINGTRVDPEPYIK